MTDYGVTPDGFVVKGIDTILAEAVDRAKQLFGPVDLAQTSTLTKLLQVAADQDALLWRSLEDTYYSRFLSTASGDALDLLGDDIGVPRAYLFAHGEVTFTITAPQPGRTYTLPEGTVLLGGGLTFHTTVPAKLTAASPNATVAVQAFDPGPAGNVAAGQINAVDPAYQQLYLTITPPTTLTVTNSKPLTGGERQEGDEPYRVRQIGRPRSMWTLDSVRSAVLDVPGVVDVQLSDPLGGVDVGQSYFGMFDFAQRLFSAQRRIGDPYFFDIVVAHEFARPWRTSGAVTGVFERVSAAVDRIRPIGIHPNIVQADHIRIGLRTVVAVQPGQDGPALVAAVKQQLAGDIGILKLGGDVLFSQVMRAIVEQPGVIDVRDLHLRRFPPEFGRITFGHVPFQSAVVEAGPGESLAMAANEIALFEQDSQLIDIKVVPA
jgi:uncharacterized phage protein gp47/JayE